MKQDDFFGYTQGLAPHLNEIDICEIKAEAVMGGWKVTCCDEILETARGQVRVFSNLDTAAKVCKDNGANSLMVII